MLVAVPAAAFVAFLVAAVAFDVPVDLPPGDVYSLTIENDTSHPVEAFMCDDGTCTRGVAPETIQPGRRNENSFNEDQYAPTAIGLADPATHHLLGCLTPPSTHSFSETLTTTAVATHSMHPCATHGEEAHPLVAFYDPITDGQ